MPELPTILYAVAFTAGLGGLMCAPLLLARRKPVTDEERAASEKAKKAADADRQYKAAQRAAKLQAWLTEQEKQKADKAKAIESERLEELARIRGEILKKIPELRKERRKSTRGRWGEHDASRWHHAKFDFYTSIISKSCGKLRHHKPGAVLALIDTVLDEGAALGDADSMTGYEYEAFCAKLLREAGWDVQETQASGDQGVDLLASRSGIRLAVQCKRYAGSVPNKAIQEVAAGAAFYNANRTAVISTGNFTRSAHALAQSTGTLLLHHSQVPALAVMTA